jgi:hypothetical protein
MTPEQTLFRRFLSQRLPAAAPWQAVWLGVLASTGDSPSKHLYEFVEPLLAKNRHHPTDFLQATPDFQLTRNCFVIIDLQTDRRASLQQLSFLFLWPISHARFQSFRCVR